MTKCEAAGQNINWEVWESAYWIKNFLQSWNFLVSDRVDEDAFDASCSDARVANNYNVLRKWMSSHQFHFNSISIQLSLEIG